MSRRPNSGELRRGEQWRAEESRGEERRAVERRGEQRRREERRGEQRRGEEGSGEQRSRGVWDAAVFGQSPAVPSPPSSTLYYLPLLRTRLPPVSKCAFALSVVSGEPSVVKTWMTTMVLHVWLIIVTDISTYNMHLEFP